MKVIVTKNYDEMSAKAFEIMLGVVKANPRAVLGLATGSTPIGLYRNMVRDHKENGTSYREIRTVNLDEYAGLPADHAQSYAHFMRENLFDMLDIRKENTNIENGMASDAASECARYNALLDGMQQDVQVLGIGSNGHIAFNEPGTPFGSVTHVVELTESTIRDNSRLFDRKKILILANGANKADAVYGLVKGEVTEKVPASVLQLHNDCVLICDEAAAARL